MIPEGHWTPALLLLAGLISGFVDSIAGGGGLMTLPSLILVLGAGPMAIGSNKIPGLLAALSALVVYWRAGHLWLRTGLIFSAALFLGAWWGSSLSPLLPREAYRLLLFLTVPLVLGIVLSRSLWMKHAQRHPVQSEKISGTVLFRLCALGVVVGFYDGAWGPGGGTFMFLALLFGANVPLLPAIATAKLANASSAGSSLIHYSIQGFVSPSHGVAIAIGSVFGAAIGARVASREAERVVRPVLVVIAILLLARVLYS